MNENSPSSTPSSSAAAFLLGGAAIDRHNPIIRDPKRAPKSVPPCTNYSQPPIIPKSQKTHHKKNNKKTRFKENDDEKNKDCKNGFNGGAVKKSWKCTNPGDFISPPGSTRYLLREKVVLDALSSDFDPVGGKKLSLEEEISKDVNKTEGILFEEKPPFSSSEVVVLRVSLHCRGCERKLRKHLSRMDGVTSYNIEFAAKKVTVTGNVTPLGVVASITKVKNAQLWSPTISSEVKNDCKGAGA
ncbi:heavy metal-associated isoprenylated plant protein 26 [Phtheirospermum japonicum]|uniref:Heavy metal-associated isoprenylated plant protein 26 n=1 Tax=Phtheirospermum japonicum TaxID=374723 RepID=A0A830D123_9LAMI|nr:heavy metal-associated isoprenylated plant protein 26 [Phtheirospermum japonicum]